MKNYKIWLKTAIFFQFLTTVIHAVTLFTSLPPSNDTEKQLFALMDNYKFDLGAGFHRTMSEMTLTLSASFCLFCLLASLVNWYLLRKRAEPGIIKGIININLFLFGICFVLVVIFAFLLPIILIGLILLFLFLSRITMAASN
jgi:hypothetical protein